MAETSNISTALATLYLPTTPAAERLAIEGNLELWKASDNSIKVNTQQILTTENMWTAILTGPKKENFFELLRAHTLIFTENLFLL
ncbi:hypothetical protein TrRE_jg6789 [Triparma retinervis]|uniref:Uncharacterized protein n=1 Tax=Triparma retinervis TaxID=2557542 RepID=A0A9W6ZB93_9STRA|nr:hypothetical protein TrRE_jg6789 [Triparma retinervis]